MKNRIYKINLFFLTRRIFNKKWEKKSRDGSMTACSVGFFQNPGLMNGRWWWWQCVFLFVFFIIWVKCLSTCTASGCHCRKKQSQVVEGGPSTGDMGQVVRDRCPFWGAWGPRAQATVVNVGVLRTHAYVRQPPFQMRSCFLHRLPRHPGPNFYERKK